MMSRWLCYLLVLVNGLVIWLATQSPVPQERPQALANLPRVSSLQLVGESELPSMSQITVPETASESPNTDCVMLSGFANEEDAQDWRKQQGLTASQARAENIQVRLPPLYWVLEPPLSSGDEASRRLAEIQQKGIDSFVIASGEQQWGISLGLFEARERAEMLLHDLSEAGLQATLRQREQSEQLHGLVGGEPLQQKASSQLLQANGLALALQPCEGVAKVSESP